MTKSDVESTFVEDGPYKGWKTGVYYKWPGTDDLMTREEEVSFFRQEKEWLESIKTERNRPPSQIYVSVDGNTYGLPASLIGALESMRPVVEAAKRYEEGIATWEEFFFFAVHYDYLSGVEHDSVVLDKKGNLHHEWYKSDTPRSPHDIRKANIDGLITNDQLLIIYRGREELFQNRDLKIRDKPYGNRS